MSNLPIADQIKSIKTGESLEIDQVDLLGAFADCLVFSTKITALHEILDELLIEEGWAYKLEMRANDNRLTITHVAISIATDSSSGDMEAFYMAGDRP